VKRLFLGLKGGNLDAGQPAERSTKADVRCPEISARFARGSMRKAEGRWKKKKINAHVHEQSPSKSTHHLVFFAAVHRQYWLGESFLIKLTRFAC
jgi:hypothetical protein